MNEKRSTGVNASERRLGYLADRTFLTPWCYANAYKGPGDELCDLLVVFGEDIVLFSDKTSVFPVTGDLNIHWGRWHKRAIIKSRSQLNLAERWLRKTPEKVYLDAKCTHRVPVEIPSGSNVRIHKIAIAHGATDRCKSERSGRGGLLMNAAPGGLDSPLTICITPSKGGMVHVFDDTSVDVVLRECDTLADFVFYLRSKEELIRAAGISGLFYEQDLLATHLLMRAGDPIGGFGRRDSQKLTVENDLWNNIKQRRVYAEKKNADRVSYLWDNIIELAAEDARKGKLIYENNGFVSTETVLRVMASESRFARRVLSIQLVNLLETAERDTKVRRVLRPPKETWASQTLYVFFSFPFETSLSLEERKYRVFHMYRYCLAIASMNRDCPCVLGIGTEAGIGNDGRSYDWCLVRVGDWNQKLESEAEEARRELNVMNKDNVRMSRMQVEEYPQVLTAVPLARSEVRKVWGKVGANAPCPCGSGKKFKRCHMR